MAYTFEQLEIGLTASYTKTVDDALVRAYAEVTGDHNPVHLDQDFAEQSLFKQRIAHGMLSAGFISTVVGMQLPGQGSIYMSQSLSFRRPVYLNDEVIASATVTALDEKRSTVTLKTSCSVNGREVVRGEAVMKVARGDSAK